MGLSWIIVPSKALISVTSVRKEQEIGEQKAGRHKGRDWQGKDRPLNSPFQGCDHFASLDVLLPCTVPKAFLPNNFHCKVPGTRARRQSHRCGDGWKTLFYKNHPRGALFLFISQDMSTFWGTQLTVSANLCSQYEDIFLKIGSSREKRNKQLWVWVQSSPILDPGVGKIQAE